MEKRLYCGLVLSLEEIALRRVVTRLWNESVFDSGEKLRYIWDIVEGEVKDKVSKLMLPESFKKRIMHLVRPIGSGILNWQVYHEDNFIAAGEVFDLHILQQLRWTYAGAIDYRKTAEELIRLEMFDVKKRYELACFYCLEDKIPLLWEEFCEKYKGSFREKMLPFLETPLTHYWACILKGEESNLGQTHERLISSPFSFNQFAFKRTALKGNRAATEYFFQKLTDEEREPFFIFHVVEAVIGGRFRNSFKLHCNFPVENLSGVLCYLLSIMSPEQQMQVFRKYSCEVLICFLVWPLENLFLDIADICWSLIPERQYAWLLYNIHEDIRTLGYYLGNLFQKFFLGSPRNFRKFFVMHEGLSRPLFSEYFHAEDTETIEVIFRNIDAADRPILVFCGGHVHRILCDFILSGRWHIVKVCIREARLSRADRKLLMLAFMLLVKVTAGVPSVEWKTQKIERFFEFFDEIDASSVNKRSAGGETLTRVKKLCCEEEKNVIPRN
ncbi:hypothetical protein AVEN_3177-1 [Araneus ventricosus]|uniref:Uncharacterized protein n=1 Tax=Araneus ventricosus TaxID=182803 RepID=A0A4Y2KI62_ARAVE|nr:hypothetical protein AVEN_3177-1 [Araneus ventricosus]